MVYTKENPVTLEIVRRTLKELVDEKGADFVYPGAGTGSCYYVGSADPNYPGDPRETFARSASSTVQKFVAARFDTEAGKTVGCGVGEVLAKLGLRSKGVAAARGGVGGLVTDFNLPIDSSATYYLAFFQSEQDSGSTWGEAFAKVEKYHTELAKEIPNA